MTTAGTVLADSFSSAPLWYTTRSTAIVGFILLTLTTVFGLLRLFYLSVLWLVSLTSKPPQNPSA